MRTWQAGLITAGLITGAALCLYGGDTLTGGTAVRQVCQMVAEDIAQTQDYVPSPLVRSCVGQEDDWRVGLALDYGMSPEVYAASERYIG